MSNLTATTTARTTAGLRVDDMQRRYLAALNTADRATIANIEAAYNELRAEYDAAVLAEAYEIVARPDVCYPEDIARAEALIATAAVPAGQNF